MSPQKEKKQSNITPNAPVAPRNRHVLGGVAALTFSNLLVKVLGMLFKIPLANQIGEEGMAYYNLAYNIFKWFYMISTAGLPVAISILISRSRARARLNETRRIDQISQEMFLLIGAIGCLSMYLGADWFAAIQGAPDAAQSMRFIAPSLFFICIASAARGYFQGFEELQPTAVSQVIEAACKLLLGILFAWYSLTVRHDPLYTVAAFAIGGSCVGTALSMGYLLIRKLRFHPTLLSRATSPDPRTASKRRIAKTLMKIAFPITLSASVMSLTDLLDSVLTINYLTTGAGIDHETALRQYGNYTSLAVPMYNLPLALVYPICSAVVPALCAAYTAGRHKRADTLLGTTFQCAATIAFPCAMGLCVLSYPILSLLYRADMAQSGAPQLSVLAASVIFVSMLSVTNAALQATGHETLPIVSMLIGAGVKLLSSSLLTTRPDIGILGVPMSTSLCYFSIMMINLFFTVKYTGVHLSFVKVFFKPAFAATGCAVVAPVVYRLLLHVAPSALACLGAVGVAGGVYVLLLAAVGGLDVLRPMLELRKGSRVTEER